ncbi:integrase core domain protein [Leptospira noguchii str. 2007001578]|uniref:Integrase core domain protein n=2 Tax=Leptospira noguchii TaxID=28182 RepID=A0ABN0J519_9LEPT|nr:integrase core domain protein [Leptospira noguchii str. 2007001578]
MMMPVSTYYYQKKPDKNEDWLVDQMSKVIEDFPGCGYRTINIELRKKGLLLNHKKIQRLMRENKLTSKRIIKFKGKTTDSVHDLKKYKNQLTQFKETGLNQVMVGDVTQYSVNGQDYFLATLMDRFNREVIGKAVSDANNTELVLCALDDAIKTRGAKKLSGCIHHTDSDVRYCADKYIKRLKENKIEISMCKGNAYENAHAESLFKTIKYQEINVNAYDDKHDSAIRIFEYIEKFNSRRPHSALKGLSPVEFRNKIEKMGK